MMRIGQVAVILGMSAALYAGLWQIVKPAWRAILASAL